MADEEIQRLTREAEASPTDEALARRLDQALRRAGRDDALRARFRFKFQCSLRYEELTPTGDPRVRACDRCRRPVRFVTSPAELAERVAQGACVAFERRALEHVLTRVAQDPRNHSATQPGAPCLVPTDLPWVDLSTITLRPALLASVPSLVAREHRLVPIEVGQLGKRVRLVFAGAPPSPRALEELRLMTGVEEVELALADPAQVEAALLEHYPEVEELLMGELAAEPPPP